MNIKYKYNQYLKAIESGYHNETTTNVELDKLCTAIFTRSKFMGVFSIDTVKSYKNNKSLIFNLDKSDQKGSHWCALYYNNNNIYIYDSFARRNIIDKKNIKKYLGTKYNIIFTNEKSDQKDSETNCGQRCVAWLCMVHFHGINNAIHV